MNRLHLLPILLVATTPVAAQEPTSRPSTRASVAKFEKLVTRWLEREQRTDKLRDELVKVVADGGAPVMQRLNKLANKARDGDDRARSRALDTVICHVGLHWLDRVAKSGVVYAGQYAVLEHLQPTIGDFYLGLLTDTPDWFLDTRRVSVVPAVRDLFKKCPSREIEAQLEAIATNEAIEPLPLRLALGYALAQWGNRSLVKDHIKKLTEKTTSKNTEERMLAYKELADVYYRMREYLTAAHMHKEFLAIVEKEDAYVAPADYYNAACSMSLSGDLVSAMQYLERCIALNNSDRIDSSIKLKRKLFDTDPEIAAVRRDKRFKKMIDAAFPPKKDEARSRGTASRRIKKDS